MNNLYEGFIQYANDRLNDDYTSEHTLIDDLLDASVNYFTNLDLSLEQVNEIICSYGIIDAIDAYENIHGSIQKTEYDIVYFLLREKRLSRQTQNRPVI